MYVFACMYVCVPYVCLIQRRLEEDVGSLEFKLVNAVPGIKPWSSANTTSIPNHTSLQFKIRIFKSKLAKEASCNKVC